MYLVHLKCKQHVQFYILQWTENDNVLKLVPIFHKSMVTDIVIRCQVEEKC